MKMDDTSATADVTRLKIDQENDKGGGGKDFSHYHQYPHNDFPRSSSNNNERGAGGDPSKRRISPNDKTAQPNSKGAGRGPSPGTGKN